MKHQVLFILVLLSLNSCVKNNPDPSWLEVTAWTLEQNSNSQYPTGELTHNFTDAWVYVDDKIMGVFEVPFKIPILRSGMVNIKIYPAIRNNGISATKKIYPFVEVFEVNKELVQNQVLKLDLVTRYASIAQFWVEDFEDPAVKITNDPVSSTTYTLGNDPSILQWGNYYGRIDLNTTDSSWIAYTDNMFLPKGQEVYLEIDYYNTNPLITGVLAISSSSIKNNRNIQLNGQDPAFVQWKKIYIDLKEVVSNSTEAEYFKQSFEAFLRQGFTESYIVLDNIKVVHF